MGEAAVAQILVWHAQIKTLMQSGRTEMYGYGRESNVSKVSGKLSWTRDGFAACEKDRSCQTSGDFLRERHQEAE